MTLQASGPISIANIVSEYSSMGAQNNLNNLEQVALSRAGGNPVSMGEFYGKSASILTADVNVQYVVFQYGGTEYGYNNNAAVGSKWGSYNLISSASGLTLVSLNSEFNNSNLVGSEIAISQVNGYTPPSAVRLNVYTNGGSSLIYSQIWQSSPLPNVVNYKAQSVPFLDLSPYVNQTVRIMVIPQ